MLEEDNMSELEDTLIEFPCQFPIKVMGTNNLAFEADVVRIVREHDPKFGENALKSRASRNGNYLSITVTVNAHSKAQLDAIYIALNACEHVKMTL